MVSRDPLLSPLRHRAKRTLERTRLWLLQQEYLDDPRHARGHGGGSGERVIRGHRVGAPYEGATELPPVLEPPPEALQVVTPELVWDMTHALALSVARARLEGRPGVLVLVTLRDCLHSARVVDALHKGSELWSPQHELCWLQPGGRLSKAYIRILRLGDLSLRLGSLPLLLVFEVCEQGLRHRALALDPLGPSRSHRKLATVLQGEAVLAPGAEQERLLIELRGERIELCADNRFLIPAPVQGLEL